MVRISSLFPVRFLFSLLLSSWALAQGPSDRLAQQDANQRDWIYRVNRLILVVPIYREFYNENIGRLLIALARQHVSQRRPLKIEVVLDVNNTADVAPEIRTENRETVAYLRELIRGGAPSVNTKHRDLELASRAVIASNLQLHVLDHTSPGYPDRNIGRVRDVANRYALSLIDTSELDTTVIAQLDGDCSPPVEYAAKIQSVFAYGEFSWAMLGLEYLVEPHSDPRLFKRHRVDSLDMAIWEFEAARKNTPPYSGSPRIAMRARTLKALGGIPHFSVGEDTELVRILRERFGSSGTAVVNLSVGTAYRGRVDSYDGAHFLQRIDWGTEVPDHLASRQQELIGAEEEIRQNGREWAKLLEDETQHHISIVQSDSGRNRSHLDQMLTALGEGRPVITPPEASPLLRSDWWLPHVQRLWQNNSKKRELVMRALVTEFPEQLGERISFATDLWARFRATATVLRLHRMNPRLFAESAPQRTVIAVQRQEPLAIKSAPLLVTRMGTPVQSTPFVINARNSSGVLELHSDNSVGLWGTPLQMHNDAARHTYRVNPQQPVQINTNNCAMQIWVANQLHLHGYTSDNSANRISRF
jgi:hypothetical protein